MSKPSTNRRVTYRSSDSSGPVPLIPIQGRFLQLFNFFVGDSIQVRYDNGLILIYKGNNNMPDEPAKVAVR